jgi:uncharacterized protein (TIGR02466 family)
MITATPIFSSPVFNFTLTESESQIFSCWDDMSEINFDINVKLKTAETTSEVSKGKYVLEQYPEQKQKLLELFNELNKKLLCYPNEFKITTSWFTRANPGTYSHFHNHKNSFYSGVLYFGDYDSNSSPIEFTTYNDGSGFFMDPDEYTIYNSKLWRISPQKNSLIFFPSQTYHRIGINESSDVRYSLAFNIIPVGKIGRGDSAMNIDTIEV